MVWEFSRQREVAFSSSNPRRTPEKPKANADQYRNARNEKPFALHGVAAQPFRPPKRICSPLRNHRDFLRLVMLLVPTAAGDVVGGHVQERPGWRTADTYFGPSIGSVRKFDNKFPPHFRRAFHRTPRFAGQTLRLSLGSPGTIATLGPQAAQFRADRAFDSSQHSADPRRPPSLLAQNFNLCSL